MNNNSALGWLVYRCNEMDITEQLNYLGDAIKPYQAQKELEQLYGERDEYLSILQSYQAEIVDLLAGYARNIQQIKELEESRSLQPTDRDIQINTAQHLADIVQKMDFKDRVRIELHMRKMNA